MADALRGSMDATEYKRGLPRINVAIRGVDGQIAHIDAFHNDCDADLKANFIPSKPQFNISNRSATDSASSGTQV